MLKNIFITGFMGVGKTTIGRLLAKKMQWNFVDTDEMIVYQAGISMQRIFEIHGESLFREWENKALDQICSQSGQVVALGGGTLTRDENYLKIARSGKLVYLKADQKTLFDRLKFEKRKRPLIADLEGEALKTRLQTLFEIRQPCYEKADQVLEVDGLSPEEVIINFLHINALSQLNSDSESRR